jgi:tetrahydromethanopterin S-methyltransferase subunit B
MNKTHKRSILTFILLTTLITSGICQTPMPEILEKGTLKEQMDYLEEKTRIYENYRAIREDMFQLTKNNAIDSLNRTKKEVARLEIMVKNLNSRIDSLNRSLESTKTELQETIRTKNSIRILGIEMNKITYNSIMWTIVAILVFLLAVGFLVLKRNVIVTVNTKKELSELKDEFEEYRKQKRLEREKMSMDHFNEIRKLRGR